MAPGSRLWRTPCAGRRNLLVEGLGVGGGGRDVGVTGGLVGAGGQLELVGRLEVGVAGLAVGTGVVLEVEKLGEHSEKATDEAKSTISSTIQITEDGPDKIQLVFSLSVAQASDVSINYFVSGSAVSSSDYQSTGQKSNDGYAGSVIIPAGQTSAIIEIEPIDDILYESDEEVLISLEYGGDYFIGPQNKVSAVILNDDAIGDCINNGNAFLLSDVSLPSGTYHKYLLESDAILNSPTTVIFKGERSIILKPGFEMGGSVFTAIIEDCPEDITSLGQKEFMEFPVFGLSSEMVHKNEVFSTRNTAQIEQTAIAFESLVKQNFQILLLSNEAELIQVLEDGKNFLNGPQEYAIPIKNLSLGTYFLKFIGEVETLYHKLIIK